MASKPKPIKSAILAAVYETAASLRRAGLVDEAEMAEFNALCLSASEPPIKRSATMRRIQR